MTDGVNVTEPSIKALDTRYGIADVARVVEGLGGLPKVVVASDVCRGEMYLHGGHVTSWKPAGANDDVLFLSSRAVYASGKSIRGGVPICFPWFGPKKDDPSAPAHGFVRCGSWELKSIEQIAEGVRVTMTTASGPETKGFSPHEFAVMHTVVFGRKLEMELVVENTGSSPFEFEEAQHTYFRVGDIAEVSIDGLAGLIYRDKTEGFREKLQDDEIRISGETDRVYLGSTAPIVIRDSRFKRVITIEKTRSVNTVVWNPWEEKGHAIADMGEGEWRQMVCVETANFGDSSVRLGPGERHSMITAITVE